MPNFELWSTNTKTMKFLNSLNELEAKERMLKATKFMLKTKTLELKTKDKLLRMYMETPFKSELHNDIEIMNKDLQRIQNDLTNHKEYIKQDKSKELKKSLQKVANKEYGMSLDKAFGLRNAYKSWKEKNGLQIDNTISETEHGKEELNFEEIEEAYLKLKIKN